MKSASPVKLPIKPPASWMSSEPAATSQGITPVYELLAKHGLARGSLPVTPNSIALHADSMPATGQNGLKNDAHSAASPLRHIMMCEVPSNAILAAQFLEYFDGFSIGSNDLTQLTLGLDRDSGLEILAKDFDERDPAVKAMLSMAIAACKAQGKYVGICGQGPSDHPDFAQWLADQGISSISLNPDTVVATWQALAK